MAISRHPEPCADPLPSLAVRSTRDSSLRSICPLTVSPASVHPELGPRSLDPDRSFWSACAELIWDRTSPTDFCNVQSTCGQPNPSSRVLAGTEASTSFLFFSCHALSLAGAVTCGEPRSVRPLRPQCWFFHLRGLPSRDADSNAPPPRIAPAVHSEDRRARVEGPSEGRVSRRRGDHSCLRGCIRFVAHADVVPLLGCLRTSAVIGATASSGGYRCSSTGRPRPSFRRRPAKSAAFQKARMPFTATTREGTGFTRREGSLRPSRRLSRSRRPHVFPRVGRVLLTGHCKATVRSPAWSVAASRVQAPFLPAGTYRAWD